ncbi:hypothetical protein SFOMI_2588 [Sphingobium fuliginis]|uniref:Uncharacterized protein n=1 Tax=Sphingobium fuliginis (strain ATCC 27551) TaxID=336203 RepID=A0A292ZGM4_SPHSA|nr:hypothetical protein SFOMI_2588 [Sphingobium fuliginis]
MAGTAPGHPHIGAASNDNPLASPAKARQARGNRKMRG